MKSIKLKTTAFFLSLVLAFSLCAGTVWASETGITREDVLEAGKKTVDYYYGALKRAQFKGVLDWPALGLFGFGEDVSGAGWTVDGKNGAYWREQEVIKGTGLSKTKNTDFERTIIGVCAAGKDPRNFGGINLVEIVKGTMLPSGHFADAVADRKTGRPVGEELVNAHLFGIIALHCAGEPIPNRDKCLEWLEKQQHKDGGFTWDVKYFDDPADYDLIESDVDMTAAALMGFAILGEDETNPAVAAAIGFLREKQLDSGGFDAWGSENPESCAWVIQALTLLGQDPMGPEWTKPSGGNPVAALLKFQLPDGSFSHVLEEDGFPAYDSGISTYEALYALADAYNGKAAYDLLHEKYRARARSLLFSDYRPGDFGFDEAMELVYDYVLSGRSDGIFDPEGAVTRAELEGYLAAVLGSENAQKNDGSTGGGAAFLPEAPVTGAQLMAAAAGAAGLVFEAESQEGAGASRQQAYVDAARKQGLVYPQFDSQKAATRAQCAWSLIRLREYLTAGK